MNFLILGLVVLAVNTLIKKIYRHFRLKKYTPVMIGN